MMSVLLVMYFLYLGLQSPVNCLIHEPYAFDGKEIPASSSNSSSQWANSTQSYGDTEQSVNRENVEEEDFLSNIANHDQVEINYDVQKTVAKQESDDSFPVVVNSSLVETTFELFEGSLNINVSVATDFDAAEEAGTLEEASSLVVGEDGTSTAVDIGQIDESPTEEATVTWPLYRDIRLPNTVRPILYEVTLTPHIYYGDPTEFWFESDTMIHVNTSTDTDMIYIHSVDHAVQNVSLTDVEANETCPGYTWVRQNTNREMLEIKSACTLTAGREYILHINSTSSMSESLRGFYYSPYKEGYQTKYIFTTMMEPTDARRVFPCFDEPDFKALFTFKIRRQRHLTAVTNLPRRTTLGPDLINGTEYYTDVFDDHGGVMMSTYLVAVAVGELESLNSSVNGTLFRTWSRRGTVNKTRYALEMGIKFMEFFENYFQIPYSLPKEDMLAVPTMSFSGMEHWGLITYRENSLFYEEGVSALTDMEWTTVLIAHEIAHQWFGNLVSPYWWDDLWLNEGFATYMMFLAVDRVMPSWNLINKLITDVRGVHMAMGVDDVVTSHPVYVAVYDPVEINRIFDLISYAKGGALIRMMNFFLGEETFRQGLTHYLKKFSYKTATHNDLWNALSEQAQLDNVTCQDVKSIMDEWILEENFPVVTVTRIDDVTLELNQSAFLQTEEGRRNRSEVHWKIPFVYTTDVESNFNKEFDDIAWLIEDSLRVTDPLLANASWIIGNVQQYGFYRVNYETDNWHAIVNQLLKDHSVIHSINRAQIINDAWNLASAGLLDFSIALSTLDYLDMETDYVPWRAALRAFSYVRTALQLTPIYGRFQSYMKKKLTRVYYDSVEATEHYDRLEYTLIAENACEYEMPACIQDATDRFIAWENDDNISIDPDLKDIVYCTGVRTKGYEAWNLVFRRFLQEQSTTEKRFLLHALTCVDQPWMIISLADTAMTTSEFSKTERVDLLIYLSTSPVGRLLSWVILEDNWDFILKEYGEDVNLLSGIIDSVTKSYNTESERRRVENFIKDREEVLGNAYPSLKGAVRRTKAKIEWMDKYYDKIKTWLAEQE